jgi:hypothetical protein
VTTPDAASAWPPGKVTPTFWVIAASLVVYVALCTGHRDLVREADAWEHHRAIKALSQQFWNPGNPTFGTSEPSVRYSPYIVTLALISRVLGIDPYDVLSGAAVFNTALLMLGVASLLTVLGRGRSAASAVIIMVGLYGGAPGYANSYALADLPWHEVNPSAFAFSCALLMWALFIKMFQGRPRPVYGVVIVLLATVELLDHPMTGIAGLVGLSIFARLVPAWTDRRRALMFVVCVGALALGACFMWPWYSFRAALRGGGHDNAYWFNPSILHAMLTEWCAPALVLCLFALCSDDRQRILVLLSGVATYLLLALAAMMLRSAALARLPLPGLIFAHLALALFADDSRMLDPRTWPARMAALRRGSGTAVMRPVMDIVLAAVLLRCLLPQLYAVVREPHLARPIVERLLGRPAKLISGRPKFDRLLASIGDHDVVLSDLVTSWAVPSSRGRIVAALHYELFTLDQPEREHDLRRFFDPTETDSERLNILGRYHVRWLLIDRSVLQPTVVATLADERAIVGTEATLTLMDAAIWRQDREGRP